MTTAIPAVEFGLISGSATWGLDFPDDLHEAGVRVMDRKLAFETPWGVSSNWQVLELSGPMTPDGQPRIVLNVYSHGQPLDSIDHACHRVVGWVMAQAGARKILAESTCGSLNRAVQPGDLIVPGDVIDLAQTAYSSLSGRFDYLCRGAQLVCPAMGSTLEQVARREWPANLRVFGTANRLVVAHQAGPRFETPAESAALRLLGADIANQSIAADATAAREHGACFVASTYVTNYVDGALPEAWTAAHQVRPDLGRLAARINLLTIGSVSRDTACGCPAYRSSRPPELRAQTARLLTP